MSDENVSTDRILLIDDDQNLLDGLTRVHRKAFNLVTACGAQPGIQTVETGGPFAAVFCDYQMPGMNGGTVLAKIHELAPDTTRVLLTGNSDLDTAVDAINRGGIFRFLRKPCDRDTFAACAKAAISLHHMMRGERDLLERTFKACVSVLCEILSLTNPTAFGRAQRTAYYVRQLAKAGQQEMTWQLETAALLSQVGLVAVPTEVLRAMASGTDLTPPQRAILGRHPKIASDLLQSIPRLEDVAKIVLYQSKRFDGSKRDCSENP